jgi:hypothetical protein
VTKPPAKTSAQDPADHLRPVRLGVLAVSAVVGVSALWGVWDAVGQKPQVWALLGFEIVTLVASVLGVLVGLGRFREAPALSTFSVAGTIFASATLGRFSAIVTRATDAGSEGQAFRQMLKDPMFDARFLAAALLAVLALCLAFGKDGRSWRKLLAGITAAVPVLVATVWIMGSGRAWLLAPVEGAGDVARVVGSLLGGLALIVLASMAVHLMVRAFEVRMAPLGPQTAPASRKAAPRKPTAASPNKRA